MSYDTERKQFYRKILQHGRRGAVFTFSDVRKECGAPGNKESRHRYWNFWRPLEVREHIIVEVPTGRKRNKNYRVADLDKLEQLIDRMSPVLPSASRRVREDGNGNGNGGLTDSRAGDRLGRIEESQERVEGKVEQMETTLEETLARLTSSIDHLEAALVEKMDALLRVWT